MPSSPAATIIFDCECGTTTACRLATIDDEHILQTDEEFTARCPACQMHRVVTDWAAIDAPNDADWYKLDLGTGTLPPATGENPFARLRPDPAPSEPSVAPTTTEPAQASVPAEAVCPECEAALDETARRTDGRAPELGWEYYECPECDHRMRPDALCEVLV